METALDRAGQPVKRGTMAHEHDVYMLLTETAVLQRDLAAIQRYAGQLETLAARDDHPLYRAIAHRAWGVAHRLGSDRPQAQARLSQALDLFIALGAAWQAGRTRLELAELAAAHDPPEAQAHAAAALAAFEALGARPDAARARAALATAQLGAHPRPNGPGQA
jgi:hypothetical protein